MFNGYNESPATSYNELELERCKKNQIPSKWPCANGTIIQPTNIQSHQSEIWNSKSHFIGLQNAVNVPPKCNCPSCFQSQENQSYQGDLPWHKTWYSRTFPVSINSSQNQVKLPTNHHWSNGISPNDSATYTEAVGGQYVQEVGEKSVLYKTYSNLKHLDFYQTGIIPSLKDGKAQKTKDDMLKLGDDGLACGKGSEIGHHVSNVSRFTPSLLNPTYDSFRTSVDRRRMDNSPDYCGQSEKFLNLESCRQPNNLGSYHLNPNVTRRTVLESFVKTVPSNPGQNIVPSVPHRNVKDNMFYSYIDPNNVEKMTLPTSNQPFAESKQCRPLYAADVGKELNVGPDSPQFLGSFPSSSGDYYGVNFHRDLPNPYENKDIQKFVNGRNCQFYSKNNHSDMMKRNGQNMLLDPRLEYCNGKKGAISPSEVNGAKTNQQKTMDVATSDYGKYSTKDCGLKVDKESCPDPKLMVGHNLKSVEAFQSAEEMTISENDQNHVPRSQIQSNNPFASEKGYNCLHFQSNLTSYDGSRRPEYSYPKRQIPYEYPNGMISFPKNNELPVGISEDGLQHSELGRNRFEGYAPRLNNSFTYDGSCQQLEKYHYQISCEAGPQTISSTSHSMPQVIQNFQTEPDMVKQTIKNNNPLERISHLELIRQEDLNRTCRNVTNKISPLRLLRKKKFVQPKNEGVASVPPAVCNASDPKDKTPPLDVRRFWATWAEEEEDNVPPTQMVVLDCHNIDPEQAGLLHLYNSSEPIRTVQLNTDMLDVKGSLPNSNVPGVEPNSKIQQFENCTDENGSYDSLTTDSDKIDNSIKGDENLNEIRDEIEQFSQADSPSRTTICHSGASLGLTGIRDLKNESTSKESILKHFSTSMKETVDIVQNSEVDSIIKYTADKEAEESTVKENNIKQFAIFKSCDPLMKKEIDVQDKKLMDRAMIWDNGETNANADGLKNIGIGNNGMGQVARACVDARIMQKSQGNGNEIEISSQDPSDDSSSGDMPTLSDLPTSEYRKNKFLDYTESRSTGTYTLVKGRIDSHGNSSKPIGITLNKFSEYDTQSKSTGHCADSTGRAFVNVSPREADKPEVTDSMPICNDSRLKYSETAAGNFPEIDELLMKLSDINFQCSDKVGPENQCYLFADSNKTEKLKKNFDHKKEKKTKKLSHKSSRTDQLFVEDVSMTKPTIKFSIQKSHDLKISLKVLNNQKKRETEDSDDCMKENDYDTMDSSNEHECSPEDGSKITGNKNKRRLLTLKLKGLSDGMDSSYGGKEKIDKVDIPKKSKKRKKNRSERSPTQKAPVLKIKKNRFMLKADARSEVSEGEIGSQEWGASSSDSEMKRETENTPHGDFQVLGSVDSAKIKLTFKRNKTVIDGAKKISDELVDRKDEIFSSGSSIGDTETSCLNTLTSSEGNPLERGVYFKKERESGCLLKGIRSFEDSISQSMVERSQDSKSQADDCSNEKYQCLARNEDDLQKPIENGTDRISVPCVPNQNLEARDTETYETMNRSLSLSDESEPKILGSPDKSSESHTSGYVGGVSVCDDVRPKNETASSNVKGNELWPKESVIDHNILHFEDIRNIKAETNESEYISKESLSKDAELQGDKGADVKEKKGEIIMVKFPDAKISDLHDCEVAVNNTEICTDTVSNCENYVKSQEENQEKAKEGVHSTLSSNDWNLMPHSHNYFSSPENNSSRGDGCPLLPSSSSLNLITVEQKIHMVEDKQEENAFKRRIADKYQVLMDDCASMGEKLETDVVKFAEESDQKCPENMKGDQKSQHSNSEKVDDSLLDESQRIAVQNESKNLAFGEEGDCCNNNEPGSKLSKDSDNVLKCCEISVGVSSPKVDALEAKKATDGKWVPDLHLGIQDIPEKRIEKSRQDSDKLVKEEQSDQIIPNYSEDDDALGNSDGNHVRESNSTSVSSLAIHNIGKRNSKFDHKVIDVDVFIEPKKLKTENLNDLYDLGLMDTSDGEQIGCADKSCIENKNEEAIEVNNIEGTLVDNEQLTYGEDGDGMGKAYGNALCMHLGKKLTEDKRKILDKKFFANEPPTEPQKNGHSHSATGMSSTSQYQCSSENKDTVHSYMVGKQCAMALKSYQQDSLFVQRVISRRNSCDGRLEISDGSHFEINISPLRSRSKSLINIDFIIIMSDKNFDVPNAFPNLMESKEIKENKVAIQEVQDEKLMEGVEHMEVEEEYQTLQIMEEVDLLKPMEELELPKETEKIALPHAVEDELPKTMGEVELSKVTEEISLLKAIEVQPRKSMEKVELSKQMEVAQISKREEEMAHTNIMEEVVEEMKLDIPVWDIPLPPGNAPPENCVNIELYIKRKHLEERELQSNARPLHKEECEKSFIVDVNSVVSDSSKKFIGMQTELQSATGENAKRRTLSPHPDTSESEQKAKNPEPNDPIPHILGDRKLSYYPHSCDPPDETSASIGEKDANTADIISPNGICSSDILSAVRDTTFQSTETSVETQHVICDNAEDASLVNMDCEFTSDKDSILKVNDGECRDVDSAELIIESGNSTEPLDKSAEPHSGVMENPSNHGTQDSDVYESLNVTGEKASDEIEEGKETVDVASIVKEIEVDGREKNLYKANKIFGCHNLDFDEPLAITDDMEEVKVSDDDKFRNIMQNCLENAKKFLSVGSVKLLPCTIDDFLEVEDCQFGDALLVETEAAKLESDKHISKDVLLTYSGETVSDDLSFADKDHPMEISSDFVSSFLSDSSANLCPEILPVDNWPYLEEEVPSSPSKQTDDPDFGDSLLDDSLIPVTDYVKFPKNVDAIEISHRKHKRRPSTDKKDNLSKPLIKNCTSSYSKSEDNFRNETKEPQIKKKLFKDTVYKTSFWQPKVMLVRISNATKDLPRHMRTQDDQPTESRKAYSPSAARVSEDGLSENGKNMNAKSKIDLGSGSQTRKDATGITDGIADGHRMRVEHRPMPDMSLENNSSNFPFTRKRKKHRFRNLHSRKKTVPDLTKDNRSTAQNGSTNHGNPVEYSSDSESTSSERDIPKEIVCSNLKSTKCGATPETGKTSVSLNPWQNDLDEGWKSRTESKRDSKREEALQRFPEVPRRDSTMCEKSTSSYKHRTESKRKKDAFVDLTINSERIYPKKSGDARCKEDKKRYMSNRQRQDNGSERSKIVCVRNRSANHRRENEKPKYWVCEVCGFSKSSQRAEHVQSHPFHCQSCHLAFKTQANFVDHLTKKHKDIKNQHHCLLCELSFDMERDYHGHLQTREHRHLEAVEKNTINTLFTVLMGHPCPVLGPVETKPEWLPTQAGTVHFYHQATPLSLALQYLKLHPDKKTNPVSSLSPQD